MSEKINNFASKIFDNSHNSVSNKIRFSGLGVLLLLMERIVYLDGAMRLSEACGMVVSKHFTRNKLMSLISNYHIFILDEKQGTISIDSDLPAV